MTRDKLTRVLVLQSTFSNLTLKQGLLRRRCIDGATTVQLSLSITYLQRYARIRLPRDEI